MVGFQSKMNILRDFLFYSSDNYWCSNFGTSARFYCRILMYQRLCGFISGSKNKYNGSSLGRSLVVRLVLRNWKISISHQRFILGLVLISGLLMLASFAMFAFPKRLKSAKPTPRIHQPGRKHPSIRGDIFIRSLIFSMCEKIS